MENRLPAWIAAVEHLDAALQPIASRHVTLADLASAETRQAVAIRSNRPASPRPRPR